MAGPDITPKEKKEERRVFARAELWSALTMVARFHSRVFELKGVDQKVSRNDTIEAFLDWAEKAYWEDKGGPPTSDDDFEAKAKAYAEKLKKKGSARK